MIFDSIANLERYSSVSPYIKEVAEELKKKDFRALPEGLYYTEKNKILIQRQEYDTVVESRFEAHKKFMDLQIVLEGEENYEVMRALDKLPEGFDEVKDIGFFDGCKEGEVHLTEGVFVISFPMEPHRPRVAVGSKPSFTKKIVVKIPY